jgi:hypothetical protein
LVILLLIIFWRKSFEISSLGKKLLKTFADGDKEIIRFVNEFRLVTVEHLEALTRRKTVWRRLPVLLEQKHVFKKERGMNEKYVYSCSPIRRRSVFTIDHDLMITDIHVALHHTGTLIYWEQGKDCWKDRVHQDAFCTLEHPQRQEANKIDYFIEADTGTQNHRDIKEKIETYLNYLTLRQVPFRVIFVSLSRLRAKNLVKLAETIVPHQRRRVFLFTTIEDLKNDCLASICFMSHDGNLVSIFPGLTVD